MDKKVKGILFLDYVRMIKSKKDADWRNYLLAQDLLFLDQKIIESEWYPFDTFERMGVGIIHEIGRDDMQTVRLWGRLTVDSLFSQFRSLICEGDPRESLVRFQVLRRSFFNFEAIDIQVLFGTFVKFKINYGMCQNAEEAASYQAQGFFERLLELSGAGEIKSEFTAKSWEGAPASILEFNWNEDRVVRRVKGVLFLDYVRMIKSKKEANWASYLQPEDLLYLKQRIADSEWYPLETFERMGVGILKEIAQGNLDLVRWWGQGSLNALAQMHKSLICEGDPRESLMRFMVLRRSFFDFGAFDLMFLSGNYAQIEIGYEMGKVAEEAASHQAVGFFEKLLELSGSSQVTHKFTQKVWAGDPKTILELEWK